MPLIGWAPKERARACGFSVAKYGPQQSTDPWAPDCGNGVRPDGSKITGNDPHDTSVEIGPEYVTGWLDHLRARYGDAAHGGVRFYNLDNEPDIWFARCGTARTPTRAGSTSRCTSSPG
ncbi:glycoside hydrolase family 44 protein [Sphaerisporangium sp. NPDC049002]|uniref:glycoside hydrolase family 44 protein n=1 Tax=unclassified Sphaerisporangium TaxID=2630420 RepID=UPI0033D6B602